MKLRRINILLSPDELSAAEKARKKVSRSEWIGSLIRKACGLRCGPHRIGRPSEPKDK